MPAMRDAKDPASETSPLLKQDTVQSIRPNDGITPEGPRLNGSIHNNGTFASHGGDAEQQQQQQDADQPLPPEVAKGLADVRKRLPVIFPALAIGIFLIAADQTIIVSSHSRIGSELNALNMTSWIATAYFLTLTSFQPLYGKLSDIFGRKPCLLFCYTVFGLGCLGCGLAQNMEQLIVARAFAGVGGGGMNVVVSVLISDVVSLRERGKWQGFINIIFASGASAGAPLGGLFADAISWRWAFLVQTPLCLVAIIAVAYTLHMPKREDAHGNWRKKLRRVDFLGASTLIAAVFLLLLALDRGSNVSWQTPISYVSLIVSLVLFVLFVLVETKVANEPFAPGHVIFDRSKIACYLCNFFGMAGSIAMLFYAPLYFQAVNNLSAFQAGLTLIPSTVCSVVGSVGVGYYMQKTGKYYWVTIWMYMMLLVGMLGVLLCSGPVVNSMVGIIIGLCFCAFGNGSGLTTTLIGLLANVEQEDQAIAIACSYLFRSLGSVFGVSISATVANQVLKDGLAARLPEMGMPEQTALEIAARVRESLAYLHQLQPDVRDVVIACYTRSTTAAFGLETGLALGAAVAAWFVRAKVIAQKA